MPNTLMTQTLPTIVGMGVVSRTTDTMFRSRRNNRYDTRGRPKSRARGPAIHRGPRGGRYIVRRGRRVYL